jgi:glycosyltransferase involved in cell wall biosynthesis
MKIIHVSTRIKIKYGGGEKFLEQLITSLDEHEHIFIGEDPVIFDMFKNHNKQAFSSPAGYEPITLKRKIFIPLSFVLGIFQFIKYYKFWKSSDLILISASSVAEPIFLVPWIKLFFPQKRIIQFLHGMCISYYYKQPLVGILRRVWEKMEIVYVSNSQLNSWKKNQLSSLKTQVIYNGVSAYDFIPKSRNFNTLKLGYIGRMYAEKKVDVLIRALSRINSKIPVEVFLAGVGEQLEEFKVLQRTLNFSSNISFNWLGFVQDTKSFYEDMDLIVFPSEIESFGLVLLESWERGVSVITSNIQAFKELKHNIPKPELELEFKLNDVDSLKSKIDYFINNHAIYSNNEYKLSLHNYVLAEFSFETMLSKYRKLLKYHIL